MNDQRVLKLRVMAASLTAAIATSSPAMAQRATQGTPPPTAGIAAPAVSREADRLLKEMSAYLGSAQQFTFHADISFDHVLPSGQKLQFAAAEDVALQRPGSLYVEWSGDLGDRQFWYDGKSVTLYDPSTPFYASEAAPAELDSMLETLLPRLHFSPPLSDLFFSNPYQKVQGNIQYGFDLGTAQINGRSCRTLAFVEKDIDWQIWIDAGPQLTPCKLVITYRSLPSQPQFSALFTDWDFAPRIAAPIFTPQLPPGTEKISFQTVAAAK
jgi:hypothetical protein